MTLKVSADLKLKLISHILYIDIYNIILYIYIKAQIWKFTNLVVQLQMGFSDAILSKNPNIAVDPCRHVIILEHSILSQ